MLAGIPALVSIVRPIILGGTRYVSVAGAPLCLAAGVGLSLLVRGRWYSRAAAALALFLVLSSDSAYLSRYYQGREKRMWREACAYVSERDTSSPMVAIPDHFKIALLYYERGRRPLVGWRDFVTHGDEYRRVWLIAEGTPSVAIERPWTLKSSILIGDDALLNAVSVFLLERSPERGKESAAVPP
jgi:hypothetical protein